MRLLIVALLVLLPAGARAQADGLVEVLDRADRGDDYIRITLAERSIEGRIRELTADSVWLGGGEAALVDIRRMEERDKEGSGVMIGALVGGVGLSLLLLPLAGLCDMDCDGVGLKVALVGATLGGTVGGLIGALVAPGVELWEERWRALP